MLPSSLGLLLAAFPHERRSQGVALWGGVGALAVATGPSFGAALIEQPLEDGGAVERRDAGSVMACLRVGGMLCFP